MGIDGIGKGPGVTPGSLKPASASVEGTRSDFSLGSVRESKPPDAVEPLTQLQRGEISFDEYLDTRVSAAVEHLQGSLSTEQLGFVREQLREQIQTDPVLTELLRRATGEAP